jgi:L-amino acid N-acyltransferase YncA
MTQATAKKKKATARTWPQDIRCNGTEVQLDILREGDEAALLAFAQSLPDHDLLFMSRDISQPRVIKAWIRESVERNRMPSLLARSGGKVVGCTALMHDDFSWSPHVGELRVVVGAQARGLGLGRQLIQEAFTQALGAGLEKIMAQMTTDQRGAITLFESLGFRPEALLAGHVRDRSGRKHDIVVLGHDVAAVQGRMAAFGMGE